MPKDTQAVINLNSYKNKPKIRAFGTVYISEIPNPYEPQRQNKRTDLHGKPLKDYFNKLIHADAYKVTVNGKLVEDFDYIVQANDKIIYVPLVLGGGGSGKQIFATVAMIALAVVTYGSSLGASGGFLASGGIAGAIGGTLGMVVGAGIMIAGSMLINSILAPSTGNLNSLPTSNTSSPTYSWTGIKTQISSGNPIPILYGTHKLGGTLIDNTLYYQERDQYLKTLLSLCHGEIEELSSENIYINDEPLSAFLNSDGDVSYQTRNGTFDQTIMEGFNTSSFNNVINYRLEYDNGSRIFTTQSTNIDSFKIHLRFDGGLFYYDDKGNFKPRENKFKIEYRKIGDLSWESLKIYKKAKYTEYQHQKSAQLSNIQYYRSTNPKPEKYTYRVSLGGGDYRIATSYSKLTGKTRITTDTEFTETDIISVIEETNQPFSYVIDSFQEDSPNNTLLELAQYEIRITPLLDYVESTRQKGIPLIAFIEEVNSTPFNHGGEALLGLKLKATEEISGNQPNYNMVVTRKPLEIKKPDGNVVYKPSNNPAWCCYDLLTNKEYGGGGKISHEDMDFNKFSEWADFCDNPSFTELKYNTLNTSLTNLSYNDFQSQISTLKTLSVTNAGGNFFYGLDYAIVLPIEDLDSETAYSIEALNKETGGITFKNYYQEYITVSSKDIDSVERTKAFKKVGSSLQEFEVLVISWVGLKNNRITPFSPYIPYFGVTKTEQGLDISIDLEFQTQEYFETPKLRFNGVIDSLSNIWEKSQDIAKVGRGQVIQRGTEYSCVFDAPQPIVDIFTDENMKDIEISYTDINEIATEVEIQYADKDINYEMTQINLRDSSLFDSQLVPAKSTVQAFGITSQEEALVFGKYLLANNKFIRRTCSGIVDIESLGVTVGDIVGVQSSIPQWGISGIITASNTSSILITEPITTEANKTYILKVKSALTDEITDYTIVTTESENIYSEALKISVPNNTIQENDTYVFGEVNSEVIPFRVVGIDRNSELERKVSLVEYNESILDFDVSNDTLRRINTPPKPKTEINYLSINETLIKNKTGNAESNISLGWESTQNTTFDIYYEPFNEDGELLTSINYRKYIAKGFAQNNYSATLPDLEEQNKYRFYVKDTNSSAIDYIDYTIQGLSIPPESVQNLKGNSSNGNIIVTWDANTEIDLSHYLVQLDNGEYQKVTETFAKFNDLKVKQYQVTVKAVDTSSNESDPSTISVQVTEPNIQSQISDSYLIEKAFRDGKMTIFVGIDSNRTNATNYDIWKIPLTSLTVDEFTYASTQLEGLAFDDLNGTTYKYYLDGQWNLCTKAQLLVIQRMLTYALKSALDDGALRVFTKQPFPPYELGDVWVDGDLIKYCKIPKGE